MGGAGGPTARAPTRRSRHGGGTGLGAIALVDVLVVALAGGEQVVQDLQPAVGEAAEGREWVLPACAVLVVVGAGPGRGGSEQKAQRSSAWRRKRLQALRATTTRERPEALVTGAVPA